MVIEHTVGIECASLLSSLSLHGVRVHQTGRSAVEHVTPRFDETVVQRLRMAALRRAAVERVRKEIQKQLNVVFYHR